MEIDIANYLHDVSDAHLSDETKAKMRAMLREISEIESIGDSCYKIARIINRYNSSKEEMSGYQIKNIKTMMGLVDKALSEMNKMLVSYKEQNDINRSFNIENEIDNYRDKIKAEIKVQEDSAQYYIHKTQELNTDKETLEKIAREQYNMKKTNEEVFITDIP